MRRELVAAFLLVCVGCGGGGDGYKDPVNPNPPGPGTPSTPSNPNPNPPAGDQVTVQDNSYSPATVNITTGTTVTWTWAAGNYSQHSVTFNDGNGSSGTKTSGTHTRSFATAGTFGYYCDVHGTGMSGTVVVTAP